MITDDPASGSADDPAGATTDADRRESASDGSPGFAPIAASSWHWRFSDDADVAVEVFAPVFASQQSAEDWLTHNVDSLLDQGVGAVTLFDGEGAVYGPMSLAAD